MSETKKARGPLFIIFLVVFIDLLGFGIVIPILPYYAKSFGASATVLGWLMASYSLLQFIFAPVWGRISDRIGRRPVLLISMCGSMISLTLMGFAQSLAWLFVGRILAGISGANISTASAYIADVTSPENRAKGMGMIGAAFGIGFIFGPAIGGVLSRFGWGAPLFAAAGLAFCNVIFAYFRLKEPPTTEELREKNRTKRFDLNVFRQMMGDFNTRSATIVFFLVTVAVTQMEVTFAIYMLATHGLGAQGAGWFLAMMGLILVAIQGGAIGRLSKRFGEMRLILIGTAFLAIGMAGVTVAGTLTGVAISLAILAFGNGITSPSLSSMASKGAAPELRGVTMGIYQSAGSLARVIGPPIAGALYDARGPKAPFLSAALIVLAAFWTLLTSRIARTQPIMKSRAALREHGLRGLLRTYGWKMFALVFMYYLVRDVILYVLIPWMIAKGFILKM